MSIPVVALNDFYLEVVRGNVIGFTAKEITGLNAAVGGTEDVWNQGGSITQSSTAAILYVSSDTVADTSLYVTITGLDANYDEISEVVKTNAASGRTPVTTTLAFLRVNSVTIDTAPAGKVYIYYYSAVVTNGVPQTASTIQAAINVAATQAYNAIYTVPRNKTMYLTGLRYASTGATTTYNVILSVIQKLYGGANVTLETIKYVDAATTVYTDKQVLFDLAPIKFPAKSEFRIAAGLAGGTALNISVLATCVEETETVSAATVTLMDKVAYLAYLAANGRTIASQNYYVIGLTDLPAAIPSTAVLADTLCTITGATNYTVAVDTDINFDANYYVSGKLVLTTKRAILTIMRCVDNAAVVKYVLAPVNTMMSIRNVKKITYLHN